MRVWGEGSWLNQPRIQQHTQSRFWGQASTIFAFLCEGLRGRFLTNPTPPPSTPHTKVERKASLWCGSGSRLKQAQYPSSLFLVLVCHTIRSWQWVYVHHTNLMTWVVCSRGPGSLNSCCNSLLLHPSLRVSNGTVGGEQNVTPQKFHNQRTSKLAKEEYPLGPFPSVTLLSHNTKHSPSSH